MTSVKSDSILVVDDDTTLNKYICKKLRENGYKVTAAFNGKDALELCEEIKFDIILLDYDMPGMNGMKVISELKNLKIRPSIIMVTAHDSMERAIEAISLGAKDFITKPFKLDYLLSVIEEYISSDDSASPGINDKTEANIPKYRMVGSSASMMKVYKAIGHVSQSDPATSVLITGESGVGKELVARQIHLWGKNRNQPFVGVNLNAMPDTLIESELFGHSSGAFTNATKSKIGKFEFSENGTLLLDEIGDISINIQIKLLRVLQEREYYPVGDNTAKKISSRIVATTNADLAKKVSDGTFREDLLFRLRTVWIQVPPLRERVEDIPLLVDFFIKKYTAASINENSVTISASALEFLQNYCWPGNVRELENSIRSAVTTKKKNVLKISDFDTIENNSCFEDKCEFLDLPLKNARQLHMDTFEKQYVTNLLKICNGKVSKAAEKAEINRQNFYKLMRKHGIKNIES